MDKALIDKIISKLENSYSSKSSKIILNGFSDPEISKNNFRALKEENKGKIAFIDGGNAEILKAGSFSLQFIRVYYTIYENRVRVFNHKKEFFALITAVPSGYKVDVIGDNISFEVVDSGLIDDISLAGGVVRRFTELMTAKEIVSRLDSSDVIVIDGDLAVNEGEGKYLEELKEEADVKNVFVCGVSKTTGMITDTGDSAVNAIRMIEPSGIWFYNVINGSTGFAKLHPKSKYIFRVDSFSSHIDSILNRLIPYSNDPIFLGYPYGLIDADRFARVSNKEKEFLKVKLMVMSGDKWKEISSLIKSSDAHSILDNVL